MNDKIEKEVIKLPPFKRFCMTIGELPTSYLESMTYYEMLVWFTNYLGKTVIPTIDNNAEAIIELQALFTELQNYVNDYFDNLDVQEEINNKLDEMVEDGTLTEIIGEYIEFSKKSYIIKEITTETIRVENSGGNVYITHIPHTDSNNEIIPIKHGFANDIIDSGLDTPTNYCYTKNATFVGNASVFQTQSGEPIPQNALLGLYIHNGELLKDNRPLLTESFIKNRYILGIKEDNELVAYTGDTLASTILNDGCIECLQSFIPILINGTNNRNNLISEGCNYWVASTFTETTDISPIYDKIYYTYNGTEYVGHYHLESFTSGTTYYDETTDDTSTALRYTRQVICQNDNGDIFFITSNGKGDIYNKGLSLYDFVTLAKWLNCKFAFVLDGGGSTASVFRNEMLNHPTDSATSYNKIYNGEGSVIRPVPDFLYFSKQINTETDSNINYLLMKVQELNKKIEDLKLTENQKMMSNTSFYELENEQHILNFKKYNSEKNDFLTTLRTYIDNVSAFPGGMSINWVDEDDETHPVIRFSKDESIGIQYLTKKLGIILNDLPKLANGTDLNNLPNLFTVARADRDQNLNGAPITDSSEGYNYIIGQLGFVNQNAQLRVQVAVSIKQSPVVMKVRVFTSSWGPWEKVQFVTNE